MGEATYYFVAVFQNEKTAKEGFEKIKQYLEMSNKAHDYWQNHRSKPKACLKHLKQKHGELFKYIPEVQADMNLNSMAGYLLSTDYTDRFEVNGNKIFFSATVWHFDKWEHLVKFAQSIGAKAGYESDEYIDRDMLFNNIAIK